MKVDIPPELPVSRTIAAKQKALSKFVGSLIFLLIPKFTSRQVPSHGITAPGVLSLQEAMNLEQQAHAREKERLERITERKRRLGMPIQGEILTKQEREARIWAFM